MNSLESFRALVAKALTVLALLHVPLLALIAGVLGRPVGATAIVAAILAAAPFLALIFARPMMLVAFSVLVALIGQTSLLVNLFNGHAWQVEMHFYYFAMLAMLMGFCDWRVILAGAGLVAVHHLILNWLLPEAIYPGGSDFARVLVHAVILIAEAAMLMWFSRALTKAFAAAEAARAQAERAAAELERLGAIREQEFATTATRGENISGLLQQFQREMADSTQILETAAVGLRSNSDEVSRAATHASAQSITASVASEETAAKITSAAQAGEELAQTIAEVGLNATQSSRLAADAVHEAGRTKETIDELAGVVHGIGQVTELIASIASQTNLLALNATIEAARAGDAGRGFAIVAQEVKALAGQTAVATQDIGRRIGAMQSATQRSVTAIAAISATITELDQFSARIAYAVEQRAEAAREIASNAHSAATSVGAVDGAISEIEAVVENTVRSAVKLAAAASDVTGQARRIRHQVDAFADNLRVVQA